MKTALWILLVTGLFHGAVEAEPLTTPGSVLEFAAARIATCETFAVDYRQSLVTTGGELQVHGNLRFKKPALARMDSVGIGQRELLVRDPNKIIWQEVTLGGVTNVMKTDPAQLPAQSVWTDPFENVDPAKLLRRVRQQYHYGQAAAGEWQGMPVYILQGTRQPPAADGRFATHAIYIHQQDGFPRRLEFHDAHATNVIEFSAVQPGLPLDDVQFRYQPPKGVNVIDMTLLWLRMRPAPRR